MLMRPFRQGVSLLQEDMSVMDDAVLPDLPSQLPAEQPGLRMSAGRSAQLSLVAEGSRTWDPGGTQPTGAPFPPPMESFSLLKRCTKQPQPPQQGDSAT